MQMHSHTPLTDERVTSAEAAEILGVDHSTVSRLSSGKSPKLAPIDRFPGKTGAKWFHRADVEALAAERRADLERRLARLNGAAS